MASTASGFEHLTREQLAILVPELLLCGHLIDRSGLPHALVAFGPDGMRDVAIEEWLGASPTYTRRMQSALRFEGDDVVTLFKGLQLDIGAPPQFMDFRYTVHDRNHGEFALAHCGALMDVEPMGEQYVIRMCHDIEDPTFDATAIATNPRAQVRPIHRPPRTPANRAPHCAWTVIIDESYPAAPIPAQAQALSTTNAAQLVDVTSIDPTDDGSCDYSGPLLSDIGFADFSHSALVRIAEEVCLQGHLLTLSFLLAIRARVDEAAAIEMARKQFTGIAGVAAERIRAALDLPGDVHGLAELLRIHPAFNPRGYVDIAVASDEALTLRIGRDCAAQHDGAWPALLDAAHVDAVQAIANAVDRLLTVTATSETGDYLELAVTKGETVHRDFGEVLVTRVSTGAAFVFDDRGRGLPLLT